MGCHFLSRGLFPDQGLNSGLLHWQASDLLITEPPGKPSEQSRQVERQAAALPAGVSSWVVETTLHNRESVLGAPSRLCLGDIRPDHLHTGVEA